MNFLAHSFFSPQNSIVRCSNMLADTIKGSNFKNFNPLVIEGVVLHRKLDEFIDNYPNFSNQKQLLQPVLGKFTSIAIDMYFDFFLANKILSKKINYNSYCMDLKMDYDLIRNDLPSEMLALGDLIFERKWLMDYLTLEGMQNIMNQMSGRIKHIVVFSDSIPIFEANKDLFFNQFEDFYQTLIIHHFSPFE